MRSSRRDRRGVQRRLVRVAPFVEPDPTTAQIGVGSAEGADLAEVLHLVSDRSSRLRTRRRGSPGPWCSAALARKLGLARAGERVHERCGLEDVYCGEFDASAAVGGGTPQPCREARDTESLVAASGASLAAAEGRSGWLSPGAIALASSCGSSAANLRRIQRIVDERREEFEKEFETERHVAIRPSGVRRLRSGPRHRPRKPKASPEHEGFRAARSASG